MKFRLNKKYKNGELDRFEIISNKQKKGLINLKDNRCYLEMNGLKILIYACRLSINERKDYQKMRKIVSSILDNFDYKALLYQYREVEDSNSYYECVVSALESIVKYLQEDYRNISNRNDELNNNNIKLEEKNNYLESQLRLFRGFKSLKSTQNV